MNNIWAPWRIEYILAQKDGCCFLCDMFGEAEDAKNRILLRGPTCAVVMNRYPYTGGHLMVCPYRHVAEPAGLTRGERLEMADTLDRALRALERIMKPQGYNIGYNLGAAAGAGLRDHLHQHVVPRWVGDTNLMPVLGGVTVVPQALDELYAKLKPAFDG